jgi:hypothetical protein
MMNVQAENKIKILAETRNINNLTPKDCTLITNLDRCESELEVISASNEVLVEKSNFIKDL